MRRQEAYITITDPEAPIVERDAIVCRHCQRTVEVKPGTWGTVYLLPDVHGQYHESPGAYCGSCAGPLCLPCEQRGGCERGSQHWERQMERYEARARLWRAVQG